MSNLQVELLWLQTQNWMASCCNSSVSSFDFESGRRV